VWLKAFVRYDTIPAGGYGAQDDNAVELYDSASLDHPKARFAANQ
jgi:hypothetical protein